MKIFVILTALLTSQCIWASGAQGSMYGYVRDGGFFPLFRLDNNSMEILVNSYSSIPEMIAPVFVGRLGKSIKILSSEDYVDVLDDDTVGTLGNIDGNEKPVTFFYRSNNSPAIKAIDDSQLSLSFYTFFSHDSWGKRFISSNHLKLSPEIIAKETDITIHAITDIDNDMLHEVWVSYKLMYGEIGAMIYELTKGGEWSLLVNHCYYCD